jgi:hypothetical protein
MTESTLNETTGTWLEAEILSFQSFIPVNYKSFDLVTPYRRTVLLTWVFDVASQMQMDPSAGFLACVYLDKFLSVRSIPSLCVLELLGFAALNLAAKLKGQRRLGYSEIETYLDHKYSRDDIISTELAVLSTLEWKLQQTTIEELIFELLPRKDIGEGENGVMKFAVLYAVAGYINTEILKLGMINVLGASILLGIEHCRGEESVKNDILCYLKQVGADPDTVKITEDLIKSSLTEL